MPFRIRCPHKDCRKYQLLEDDTRGGSVECLVCKKTIDVDAALAEDSAEPKKDQEVRKCPRCGARMRVSSSAARVRCPKCQTVF